jgi:hypothetical protein
MANLYQFPAVTVCGNPDCLPCSNRILTEVALQLESNHTARAHLSDRDILVGVMHRLIHAAAVHWFSTLKGGRNFFMQSATHAAGRAESKKESRMKAGEEALSRLSAIVNSKKGKPH